MRILIITNHFWPENFRINDLALGLKERGHEVVIYTGIPDYPEGKFYPGYGLLKKRIDRYQGIKVIHFPVIPRGRGGFWNLTLNYLSSAIMASLCIPFYCFDNFDIIFVFETSPITIGLPAVIARKLRSIPVVFWVLDLWPESLTATGAIRARCIVRLVEKLTSFIYSQCDKILIASPGFARSIEAFGCHSGKIEYFPNWVEAAYETLAGTTPAGTLPLLPPGFKIMFAGNIGTAQSFETILKAAETLSSYTDIHWIILGDGRRSDWVKEQIAVRGLTRSVHVLGLYPPNTMPAFFAQADVMLVTLRRDPIFSLTVPGKIQSYMACGRPIIAALDGEGARLIEDAGAGLSRPAEDAAGLSEAVLAMYNMPKTEREEMGRRGRAYSQANFDRTILLDRLEKWMENLVISK